MDKGQQKNEPSSQKPPTTEQLMKELTTNRKLFKTFRQLMLEELGLNENGLEK